jgi:hypothetical protein
MVTSRSFRSKLMIGVAVGAFAVSGGWMALSTRAHAQVNVLPATQTAWSSLSRQQREALSPLESTWSQIDATRQQKWLDVAQRFPSMSAQERERVQMRMSDWARLSPTDRGRARLSFLDLRQVAPDERQSRWEAYQQLPEAKRRALALQAQTAKPVAIDKRAEDTNKSGVVPATPVPYARARPVAPSVVQAGPGATTNLVSNQVSPPLHQQSGMPKLNTQKGFVDPKTLLPMRGAQGAAASAPTVAPVAPARP